MISDWHGCWYFHMYPYVVSDYIILYNVIYQFVHWQWQWPKLARQKCSKLLKMTQTGPKKLLKIAQSYSKLLKMGQQVSIGVMCLHITGAKVVITWHCLLPVSIVSWAQGHCQLSRRLCLLLRSEPSIVNLNWEGSLVMIVSINGSRKNTIAFIEKNPSNAQFLLFRYCLLVIPQSDSRTSVFFGFFWDLKRYRIPEDFRRPNVANSELWYYMLVGGWAQPLWKMMEFVSWGYYSQYMESHKKPCSSHQPDMLCLLIATLCRWISWETQSFCRWSSGLVSHFASALPKWPIGSTNVFPVSWFDILIHATPFSTSLS